MSDGEKCRSIWFDVWFGLVFNKKQDLTSTTIIMEIEHTEWNVRKKLDEQL